MKTVTVSVALGLLLAMGSCTQHPEPRAPRGYTVLDKTAVPRLILDQSDIALFYQLPTL